MGFCKKHLFWHALFLMTQSLWVGLAYGLWLKHVIRLSEASAVPSFYLQAVLMASLIVVLVQCVWIGLHRHLLWNPLDRNQRYLSLRLLAAFWSGVLGLELLGLFYWTGGQGGERITLFLDNSPILIFHQWPLLLWIVALTGAASWLRKQQLQVTDDVNETTGSYGTAQWATLTDINAQGFLKEETGVYGGVTRETNQTLFLPLQNRLIVAPPGLWKSTTTSIPALLSYNGPCFVLDVKGELWAVTARYRHQTLKRKVVAIDPFGLTKTREFAEGKPDALLQEGALNPFDWIPEDAKTRDRMINAFASSFVVNEGKFAKHFDENARILIRGYMDYLMRQPKDNRSLQRLYELMSEPYEEAEMTFQAMLKKGGRAQASASQILRVGDDERGSILSTSYRQLDWLSDSNIQSTLSHSNFDLRDFVKGNLDIYVILPEDQVKEHHRLMRMMLALLMSLIVQTPPSELPKQKMLFLLDELAQLGYAPDVEQCIEVLRARGVVVWTVFQTLSQMEHFEKPDLFKGASIKHIYTNDDTKTMEWIQTLAAKKTIRTKTLSINNGDSKQKMQVFGGTVSSGEGESIHETGVDLIPLNQIRELPINEQFIFIQGQAPIHAYKQRYFEHPMFDGRYDDNPVEQKRTSEHKAKLP